MDQRIGSGVSGSSGRGQWIGYGFLAGIVVGVLMGWMFAGFVGALFRVALFAMAVVPVVLLYIAWRKVIRPWLRPPAPRAELVPFESIETRAVVHSAVREPRAS